MSTIHSYQLRDGQKEMKDQIESSFKKRNITLIEAPAGTGKSYAAIISILPFSKKIIWTSRDRRTYQTPIKEIIKLNKNLIFSQFVSKKDCCVYPFVKEQKDFHEECNHATRYNQCTYYTNTIQKYDPEDKISVFTEEAEAFISKLCRQIQKNTWQYELYNYDLASYVNEQSVDHYCPYEIMRGIAKKSKIIFCDYWNILFSPIRDIWLQKNGCGYDETTLVIDEADDLIGRLEESITKRISDYSLNKLISIGEKEIKSLSERISDTTYNSQIISYNGDSDDLIRNIKTIVELKEKIVELKQKIDDKVRDILQSQSKIGQSEIVIQLSKFLKIFCDEDTLDPEIITQNLQLQFIDIFESMEQYLSAEIDKETPKPSVFFQTLKTIIEKDILNQYIVSIGRTPDRLKMNYAIQLKPLDLSEGLSDGKNTISEVLSQPKNVLIMSATLGTPELFAKTIGLEDYSGYSVKSFIVPESQYFLYIFTELSSRLYERPRNIPRYAQFINSISKRFPKKRILVAFPSKLFKRELFKKIEDNDNLSSVVFGEKGTRGADYSGLFFNILIGYPELPPNEYNDCKKEYLIEKYGKKLGMNIYKHSSDSRAIQLMGRTLRRKNDRSIIILADPRYGDERFIEKLPPHFKNNYAVVKTEQDLMRSIEENSVLKE